MNLAQLILGCIGILIGFFGGAFVGLVIAGKASGAVFGFLGGLAVGWVGKHADEIRIIRSPT